MEQLGCADEFSASAAQASLENAVVPKPASTNSAAYRAFPEILLMRLFSSR
jgi:hypothetical protein